MALYYTDEPDAEVSMTTAQGQPVTFRVRGHKITDASRSEDELVDLPGVTSVDPNPSVPPTSTDVEAEPTAGDR